MGGLISYSAIATKLRAMQSRLLDEEDYRKLAAMENIPDAVAYLKKNPSYQAVLGESDVTQLHRGDIERLMVGTLYYDFSRIYHFCSRKQKQVLRLYIQRYEIAVLKRALRRIFNHGDRTGEVRALREVLQKYTEIPLEAMAQTESIPELLEVLKDTEYAKSLAGLEHVDKATLFDYEMTLDLYYFSRVWAQKGKFLKGKELEMVTRTFGSKIDLLNMMWIYRAKTYYQMSEGAVFALVIPVSYKLKDEDIRRLVTAADAGEMERAILKTHYGKRFLELKEKDLEAFYRQLLQRIYREERRKNPYSMAAVTTYLYDKEQEIDRLTTVLECVRYGLAPEQTLSYVRQSVRR